MDAFFPFIHQIKENKKEELLPLYIELVPPDLEQQENDKKEAPRVIIIDL